VKCLVSVMFCFVLRVVTFANESGRYRWDRTLFICT
jgi:hypothetical protein